MGQKWVKIYKVGSMFAGSVGWHNTFLLCLTIYGWINCFRNHAVSLPKCTLCKISSYIHTDSKVIYLFLNVQADGSIIFIRINDTRFYGVLFLFHAKVQLHSGETFLPYLLPTQSFSIHSLSFYWLFIWTFIIHTKYQAMYTDLNYISPGLSIWRRGPLSK